ncbi:hypothetical protein ES703_95565 [subsurface metagenome]
MGSIRRLDSNVDIQAFPGAHFIINNDIPKAQCTEAQIEGDTAETFDSNPDTLVHPFKFTGFNLTGKVCHITASVGGETGDFAIITNTNSELTFGVHVGAGNPVTYHVTDAGEFELTRNEKSFAAFIHAAGYAYTFKGGKLFTNMPNGLLKEACTLLWNPQT